MTAAAGPLNLREKRRIAFRAINYVTARTAGPRRQAMYLDHILSLLPKFGFWEDEVRHQRHDIGGLWIRELWLKIEIYY
jgi:hypothetical protein